MANNFKTKDKVGTIIFMTMIIALASIHGSLVSENSMFYFRQEVFLTPILIPVAIINMLIGLSLSTIWIIWYKKPERWVKNAFITKILSIVLLVSNTTFLFLAFSQEGGIGTYIFSDALPFVVSVTLMIITFNSEVFGNDN